MVIARALHVSTGETINADATSGTIDNEDEEDREDCRSLPGVDREHVAFAGSGLINVPSKLALEEVDSGDATIDAGSDDTEDEEGDTDDKCVRRKPSLCVDRTPAPAPAPTLISVLASLTATPAPASAPFAALTASSNDGANDSKVLLLANGVLSPLYGDTDSLCSHISQGAKAIPSSGSRLSGNPEHSTNIQKENIDRQLLTVKLLK